MQHTHKKQYINVPPVRTRTANAISVPYIQQTKINAEPSLPLYVVYLDSKMAGNIITQDGLRSHIASNISN